MTTAPREIEVTVPGGHGRAFEARRGQYVTIEDVAGQQIGDLVAFTPTIRPSGSLRPTPASP